MLENPLVLNIERRPRKSDENVVNVQTKKPFAWMEDHEDDEE